MQTWQYTVAMLKGCYIGHEEALDQAGRHGWELVSVIYAGGDHSTAYLKRPTPTLDRATERGIT